MLSCIGPLWLRNPTHAAVPLKCVLDLHYSNIKGVQRRFAHLESVCACWLSRSRCFSADCLICWNRARKSSWILFSFFPSSRHDVFFVKPYEAGIWRILSRGNRECNKKYVRTDRIEKELKGHSHKWKYVQSFSHAYSIVLLLLILGFFESKTNYENYFLNFLWKMFYNCSSPETIPLTNKKNIFHILREF